MEVAYLALGANLGERERHLQLAVEEIKKRIGQVITLSAFYVTAPWGFASSHTFLNAACGVRTTLSPVALLEATQCIERKMGRTAKSIAGTYTDRLIDIDILLYGEQIIENEKLEIPHPLMEERRFVLEPLVEIAPDAFHPIMRKTVRELYTEYTKVIH